MKIALVQMSMGKEISENCYGTGQGGNIYGG